MLEQHEIVTDQPVVVLVEAQEPVLWRTPFEFFGGLLMFALGVALFIAAMAVLAVLGVVIATVVLAIEMRRGWTLDRAIARRLP